MAQNLVSSVPGVYSALLSLVTAAAANQSPAVSVFPFELGQYEPGQYVTVEAITGPEGHGDGPVYEWEALGSFSQRELYGICGRATVFTGDSVADGPGVAVSVLAQTLSLFQSVVMTPVMSNRGMPVLGTTGPSPYMVLPAEMAYEAGVGTVGDGPGGWVGSYRWSFRFEALITPA